MKVCTLYSGSKGNAALIFCNNALFLVDIGVSYSALCFALEKLNLSAGDISAAFITHSHTDHVCGAAAFAAKNPKTPIFVHKKGANEFFIRTGLVAKTFETDAFFHQDVKIEPYLCFHDAPAACGFKFSQNGLSAACVTDTGRIDAALTSFLRGCKTVIIESNHDINMLACGGYPPLLKRRISGGSGHLSNAQTAELLRRVCLSTGGEGQAQLGVENIILAHLSENNNTPELAYKTALDALEGCGVTGRIKLYVALQNVQSEVV